VTPTWGLLLRDLHSLESHLDRDLLVHGDALATARCLPDACLDLIYLDPPFGAGRKHRVLQGRNGRFGLEPGVAFDDPLERGGPIPGMPPWLAPLLAESRRILRVGGALFLHLDYRSAHRARCLLDDLYGSDHFLNEIIWHYATGGIPGRWLARKHDTILYYRNGPGHTFHKLTEKKYLAHRMSRAGVEEFHDEKGWYRYRSLDDVWAIPWLTQDAKERTGYPTQKPLALLRRILEIATDPGDRVADFCCGSGTLAVAARDLRRRWLSVDVSGVAIEVACRRLDGVSALRTGKGAAP